MSGPELNRRRYLQLATTGASGLAGCLTETSREQRVPRDDFTERSKHASVGGPCPRTKIEGDDPLFVPYDVRRSFRCIGSQIDDYEALGQWELYDGTLSATTDDVYTGTQSANLSTSGDRVWIYRRFPSELDLSGQHLSLAANPGNGETRANMLRVQVLAPDYSNRVDMRQGFAKLGGWLRFDLGPTALTGTPDLSTVSEIRIESLAKDAARIELQVDDLRSVPSNGEGLVMLTFDDIPATQYDTGFPILEEFGFTGVAGAIPWVAGKDGFMDIEDLHVLQEASWDIVNHPQIDKPLHELPIDAQRAAIEETKRWLLDHGFRRGADFVIWPYVSAGADTFSLASKYYRLGFGGGVASGGIPPTDPLSIGRVDGESIEATRRTLDFAAEFDQLAVVMYHQIGGDGVPVEAFRETMAQIERLGLRVITATDLWSQYMGYR